MQQPNIYVELRKAPARANATVSVLGRAFVVWLVFIATESVLGTLRTLLLEPRVGVAAAKQIGFVSGSFALLLVAWLMIRWIGHVRRKMLMAIGLFWAALTFAFEIALGYALGRSWTTLLADYDPRQGGLMWLALLLLLFAPLIATALHGLRRGN